MSTFQFTPTQDWFSGHRDEWRSYFSLIDNPNPRALEIGTWEGRSAVFLLQEFCTSTDKRGGLTIIDHFDLMQTGDGQARFAKVKHNLALAGGSYRIVDEFSVPGLMRLLEEEMRASNPGFDWVYIDGSHRADDTFLDAEMSWRLSRKGAVVVFDDYRWDKEPEDSIEHPKRGIDAFLQLHTGEYEILCKPEDYQMVVRKTLDMRIGFLMMSPTEVGSAEKLGKALDYGVNMALAVNSSYAMPAAVAIHSAILSTSARCTVYVYDVGLSLSDRAKLIASVPKERSATLLFIEQAKGDISDDKGIAWAKLDLIRRLPVERVLYLDADVLVRKDLIPLWNTDLGESCIGAVIDVGFPKGHAELGGGLEGSGYFNAGVLLLNLARARMSMSEMEGMVNGMLALRFQDQDLFNIHFASHWKPLDLRYNAQGLGTYANIAEAARDVALSENAEDSSSLLDPTIVHFTGPVSPSLGQVLNPWVQPVTAKPWGYSGAPGHPFVEEWWKMVELTDWKGIREQQDYQVKMKADKKQVVREGVEDFDRRTSWVSR